MSERANPRARLAASIATDCEALTRLLTAACPAPSGHEWRAPTLEDRAGSDIVEDTRNGVSIYLVPIAEEEQPSFHVEVRWYWKNDGADPIDRPRPHQALIWCRKGARRAGFTNLLDATESFFQADTIDVLAERIAEPLRRIIVS